MILVDACGGELTRRRGLWRVQKELSEIKNDRAAASASPTTGEVAIL